MYKRQDEDWQAVQVWVRCNWVFQAPSGDADNYQSTEAVILTVEAVDVYKRQGLPTAGNGAGRHSGFVILAPHPGRHGNQCEMCIRDSPVHSYRGGFPADDTQAFVNLRAQA